MSSSSSSSVRPAEISGKILCHPSCPYRSYKGRISQCCIYSLFQLSFSSALLVIFVILICLIVHHIEQGVFILEIHHLRTVILQVHIEIAL